MAKLTNKDKGNIIEAYQNLETMISLADKYGVTRQAIYKLLKRSGIDTRKRRIRVSCSSCGNILLRTKARVRRQNAHFCNYECYHAYLEAGNGNPYIHNRYGQKIGRKIVSHFFDLEDGMIVHHEDRNTLNNLPHNLKVFAYQGDHIRHHRGFEVTPLWDGSKLPASVGSVMPVVE